MVKKKKRSVPPMTDAEAYKSLLSGYTKMQIAAMLGISKQSITRWTEVPLRHVKKLSEATGIPKAHLRPSDFA